MIEAKINLRLSRKNSRDACSLWISSLGKKANLGYEKRMQLGVFSASKSLSNSCEHPTYNRYESVRLQQLGRLFASKLSTKMIFGSLLLTGQLTEHLRRKSEQTLVAAADLRLSALFLEVFGWDVVARLMGIDWYSIDGYVSLWLQCNMNTCNESRRFTRVRYFFTSGGSLHDVIADFLIKEQCSPESSWNISAKLQESWWQLYKGMLWVFKLKKRPCARQKRRELYQILHSVLSIYEIYWNCLRSWFLAIFQGFHLVLSMTPSIHLLCSGSFTQILIRSDIAKFSSTEMDIYPSFYAQGVASQPQTLCHRVAKTLARSGSSREGLWRSSPGGWVKTVGFAPGNSAGTMTLLDSTYLPIVTMLLGKKCSEVETPWQALTNIDV